MSRYILYFLPLSCYACICTPVIAQQTNWAIVIKVADRQPLLVLHAERGDLWEIPEGHQPQAGRDVGTHNPFFHNHHFTHDFDQGALPIYGPEGWYLLDRNGNKIADLGNKYSSITTAEGGFHRASERLPQGGVHTLYLDQWGKEQFDGARFRQATAFNDGHAVVQLRDKSGSWQIIDTTGNVTGIFPDDVSPYISHFTPFSDGLTYISIARPRGYDRSSLVHQQFYFDRSGNKVLDMIDVIGAYTPDTPRKFVNGIASCLYADSLVVFNSTGKVLKKLSKNARIDHITSEHVFVSGWKISDNLYDHEMHPVVLASGPNEHILCRKVNEEYIFTLFKDTVNMTTEYQILDARTYQTLFRTPEKILFALNGRVVLGNDERPPRIAKVTDMNHSTIYIPDISSQIFKSIDEALAVSGEVHHLSLTKPPSLQKIGELVELRSLEISQYQGSTLPANIVNLKSLEILNISNCKQLQFLPAGMEELASLKNLFIMSCTNMKDIEKTISVLPGLERVVTQGYVFDDAFLKRMKAERPHLDIDAWQSLDFIDQTVEEETLPQGTPPAPPPPPRGN